ncbi:MAG: hypothetical protein ACXU9U_04665, partial [Parachlamydiaceae bacterium]
CHQFHVLTSNIPYWKKLCQLSEIAVEKCTYRQAFLSAVDTHQLKPVLAFAFQSLETHPLKSHQTLESLTKNEKLDPALLEKMAKMKSELDLILFKNEGLSAEEGYCMPDEDIVYKKLTNLSQNNEIPTHIRLSADFHRAKMNSDFEVTELSNEEIYKLLDNVSIHPLAMEKEKKEATEMCCQLINASLYTPTQEETIQLATAISINPNTSDLNRGLSEILLSFAK